MSNLSRAITSTVLFGFIYFSTYTAHAAIMLSGGLTHEHNVQPGGTVMGVLELRNTANTPTEVKIYQENIQVDASGKSQFSPRNRTHARSNINWISLANNQLVIAPGSTQQVPYTLRVPTNNGLNGSYWSTLMLEPLSNSSPESQTSLPKDKPSVQVRQKMRYSVRVISNVGNRGQANLIFSPPNISKPAPNQRWFTVNVRNHGNLFTRPKVWLDVFDLQGRNMGRFKADRRSLYASESKNFKIDIARLSPGAYKGLLAAEDDQNGQIFGSDINLNIQP